jgi:hypothetical protein
MKKWRPGIPPRRRHKKFIIIQLCVHNFLQQELSVAEITYLFVETSVLVPFFGRKSDSVLNQSSETIKTIF